MRASTGRCCTGAWTIARRCSAAFGCSSVGSLGAGSAGRPRLLPERGFRRRCACTRARLPARASKKTELIFAAIEDEIRQVIPPREIENIIDNIGIPNGGFNLAFGDSPTIGVSDGDILISLNEEEHGSTAEYTDRLRKRLQREVSRHGAFSSKPANITNQILNFGLPAPIDVQVVGRNAAANYEIAQQIAARIAQDSGRGRCAHPPGGGLPRDRSQRGPQQGRHRWA